MVMAAAMGGSRSDSVPTTVNILIASIACFVDSAPATAVSPTMFLGLYQTFTNATCVQVSAVVVLGNCAIGYSPYFVIKCWQVALYVALSIVDVIRNSKISPVNWMELPARAPIHISSVSS